MINILLFTLCALLSLNTLIFSSLVFYFSCVRNYGYALVFNSKQFNIKYFIMFASSNGVILSFLSIVEYVKSLIEIFS